MADKAQLLQKRVTAIGSAIDDGNIRKAVLLAESKDIANLAIVKALKAWAFDRGGDRARALELVNEVLVSMN